MASITTLDLAVVDSTARMARVYSLAGLARWLRAAEDAVAAGRTGASYASIAEGCRVELRRRGVEV